VEGGVLAGSRMGSGTVVIVGLVDCLDGWRAIFGLAWCFGLWSIGGGVVRGEGTVALLVVGGF
jgi:hypothetical protein